MPEIIPSVLAKDESELSEITQKLSNYSGPLHIDIADGIFVPSTTVGREEIERAFPSQMLDIHLMVQRPEDVIPLWIDMPNLRTIIFHIEAAGDKAPDILDTIIKKNSKQAGIAINPETNITALAKVVNMTDLIQFMTVDPGFYGAAFREGVVINISAFHNKYPSIPIAVDGGITPDHIQLLRGSGVSIYIGGSYIIQSSDVGKAIAELESKV